MDTVQPLAGDLVSKISGPGDIPPPASPQWPRTGRMARVARSPKYQSSTVKLEDPNFTLNITYWVVS